METFFMNSKNSKTNESYKFEYDLIDKLDLKNLNKNMALANLSIYYTWKNVKSTYNNNKFKISAPTWNETFDLPDGSYNISEIQDYIEYTFKKELNASTYSIYLFLFRRFECTTLIIKELLLNLSHFIFTNIAIFIKP